MESIKERVEQLSLRHLSWFPSLCANKLFFVSGNISIKKKSLAHLFIFYDLYLLSILQVFKLKMGEDNGRGRVKLFKYDVCVMETSCLFALNQINLPCQVLSSLKWDVRSESSVGALMNMSVWKIFSFIFSTFGNTTCTTLYFLRAFI